MSVKESLAPLKERWDQLADQERQMLTLIAALLVFAIVWLQLLAPARATLRTADVQAKALGTQMQQMQKLQSEALTLQKQPALNFDAALKALTAATQQTLGAHAQMTNTTEHASITLREVPADVLAQWIVQARINARSVPVEAQLSRSTTEGQATWNGVVLMSLPGRQSP
jgi:general secretion pathway protein M